MGTSVEKNIRPTSRKRNVSTAPEAFNQPAGRPQSKERGDAILSVTLDILGERGYAGLTVQEIVSRARVSNSTIYRRWPTKEELAMAAFDRLPELKPVERSNLIDELLELLLQYYQFLHQTPLASVLPALISEGSHNPTLARALRELVKRRRMPGKVILARAVERGELPPDTDLDKAIEIIMAPLLQWSLFDKDNLDPDDFRYVLAVIIAGLNSVKTVPKP